MYWKKIKINLTIITNIKIIGINFNNFPTVYSSVDDDVELTDYIHDRDIPVEQKLEDLIYLTSILHNKTTFYKTVDEDYIKTIYETTIDKQDRMFKYYRDRYI